MVVACIMENSPEFLAIFIGLVRMGFVPALINTNLRGKSLENSLAVCKPRAIIVSSPELLESTITDIHAYLLSLCDTNNVLVYCFCHPKDNVHSFVRFVDCGDYPCTPPPPLSRSKTALMDTACLIFTSGTTGMPKAAVIRHLKFIYGTRLVGSLIGLKRSDRVYVTLPLYHSAGLILGVFNAWEWGASVVLEKRFSASIFWQRCCDKQVTAIQARRSSSISSMM